MNYKVHLVVREEERRKDPGFKSSTNKKLIINHDKKKCEYEKGASTWLFLVGGVTKYYWSIINILCVDQDIDKQ